MFSDGIQDQFGGETKQKFSTKRLKAFLEKNYNLPMQEQKEKLVSELRNWMMLGSEEQIDDMLIVGVRV